MENDPYQTEQTEIATSINQPQDIVSSLSSNNPRGWKFKITIIFVLLGLLIIAYFYFRANEFQLPQGETEVVEIMPDGTIIKTDNTPNLSDNSSARKIFITDNVKHSVPLNEILSGGPPKDGIPSIDDPKFISISEADLFLNDNETGTGLCISTDCRFYPYQILVWHEIVNDFVNGEPVLVTYCPLCLTGIVFERTLEGQVVEFGTSGKLWQSNLVMYNRTDNPEKESLWSQVLGEAIVGEFTATSLTIISSDVIRYKDWKKLHPNTKILSKDTGIIRNYGYDPYGDYYTSNQVLFGAPFTDDRLHPKEYVLGIQINGQFKAYHSSALRVGETKDTFNGETIFIQKKVEGEVRMFKGANKEHLPYIGGFWFSWLAVHPNTELFK